MITATAPGKLVLLGEYAVLEGAPALVTAVDRRVRVQYCEEPGGDTLEVDATPLDVRGARIRPRGDSGDVSVDPARLGRPLALVLAVVRRAASRSFPAGRLRIDSSPFYGPQGKLGLGSSAAIAAALTGVLGPREAPPHELFERARESHRAMQGGRGSGIDVAASVFGGTLAFRTDAPPEPVSVPHGVRVVVVRAGAPSSTPDLVGRVTGAASRPGPARESLDRMTRISAEGVEAARAGDAGRFLEAVRSFARAYRDLGEAAGAPLLGGVHARAFEVAEAAGAAYKPSGAGAGDVGLVFRLERDAREDLGERLAAAGTRVLALRLGEPGVEVQERPAPRSTKTD